MTLINRETPIRAMTRINREADTRATTRISREAVIRVMTLINRETLIRTMVHTRMTEPISSSPVIRNMAKTAAIRTILIMELIITAITTAEIMAAATAVMEAAVIPVVTAGFGRACKNERMADFHAAYAGSLCEHCHDVRMGVQQNGEKE